MVDIMFSAMIDIMINGSLGGSGKKKVDEWVFSINRNLLRPIIMFCRDYDDINF